MLVANLFAQATLEDGPLHIVLIESRAALGEGVAYGTPEPRHLLNVPAGRMSALSAQPDDLVDWARAGDPDVTPADFLPRQTFAAYLRACLERAAARVVPQISAEVLQDEVIDVTRTADGPLRLTLARHGATRDADVVVLATGHGPPDDPLAHVWTGPRDRCVADPWSPDALASVEPDDAVLLIGTGLTAVDVFLALAARGHRTTVLALSRRGLLPQPHVMVRNPPIDPSPWLEPLLARPDGPTVRALLHSLLAAADQTGDWRSVLDGLRPHTPRLWRALEPEDARRFLRHLRAFWDVHRHRMAPQLAQTLADARARGRFHTAAGRVRDLVADEAGVAVTIEGRGERQTRRLRVHRVIHCTGPGGGLPNTRLMQALAAGGVIERDALGLGARTTAEGHPIVQDVVTDDVILMGPLRRSALWESTAVPELRVQAQDTARALLVRLAR